VHAAARAITINKQDGDRIRERLAANVWRFRRRLAVGGIDTTGGLFPVQIVARVPHIDARELFASVSRMGVRAPLLSSRHKQARIAFLLNARHTGAEIDRAADALIATANGLSSHKSSEVYHGAGNGQRPVAGVAAR
jgi:8-amino-7-oxononanoate synthase